MFQVKRLPYGSYSATSLNNRNYKKMLKPKEKPYTTIQIQVLEELKKVGKNGITLKKLAEKLDRSVSSVYNSMTARMPIAEDGNKFYYMNWSER